MWYFLIGIMLGAIAVLPEWSDQSKGGSFFMVLCWAFLWPLFLLAIFFMYWLFLSAEAYEDQPDDDQ